MADQDELIQQLLLKLDILLKRQEGFSKEIESLRQEIDHLKTSETLQTPVIQKEEPVTETYIEFRQRKLYAEEFTRTTPKQKETRNEPVPPSKKTPARKNDLEKLIGENLISKIGIAITVIGVAIGAKYSIDHNLVSPLTRIILGYLMGIGLLGFGFKLKTNYEKYSAVLVGGAIAIMYFITYSAYSFYSLIPQVLAFTMMVAFTAFGVLAAMVYSQQIIALIGLVGAYAVPFLLSDGSGQVVVLFSYIAIINMGILVIAFKKYWKILYYASFGLSWAILSSWIFLKYHTEQHFALALMFTSIYFATFYLTFLAYKFKHQAKFEIAEIALLISNSFIYYGLTYFMISQHETGKNYLGLFTLGNALIHFMVSAIIYKQKLSDKNLFYLISGLVLVFITIAIPVQLNGHWVTLLWTGEATLLFWIGRTKTVSIYEKLSYPLMILALLSIVQDWSLAYLQGNHYSSLPNIRPCFNIHFLSTLLILAALGFMNYVNRKNKVTMSSVSQKDLVQLLNYFLPIVFITTLYFGLLLEIAHYWNQLYRNSVVEIRTPGQENPEWWWNFDLVQFKKIWLINYTLLFLSALAYVNHKKIKNETLGFINFILILMAVAVFLTQGLYVLSELRSTYLDHTLMKYYHKGISNLTIRYISIAMVIWTLFATYKYILQDYIEQKFEKIFDILLYVSILWIASSELINCMDLAGSTQSHKLGLSILWGCYSLGLIALGIWKKKKPLRMGAIWLFGLTLLKLFFYDLGHLNTISKTIVFVSLGILLLIISFLYNKYKNIISDDAQSE